MGSVNTDVGPFSLREKVRMREDINKLQYIAPLTPPSPGGRGGREDIFWSAAY
jgi:hypothetical protein